MVCVDAQRLSSSAKAPRLIRVMIHSASQLARSAAIETDDKHKASRSRDVRDMGILDFGGPTCRVGFWDKKP
jgi:hypothetical protein